MALLKKFVTDVVDIVEDFATAIIGAFLVAFLIGQYYGAYFANKPEFYYPLYLFIALLVLKLLKDVFYRVRGKTK